MTATTVKRKPAAATFGPPPCPPGLAEPYVPYDYSLIDAIPGPLSDYEPEFTERGQYLLLASWMDLAYASVAEVSRDSDWWLYAAAMRSLDRYDDAPQADDTQVLVIAPACTFGNHEDCHDSEGHPCDCDCHEEAAMGGD